MKQVKDEHLDELNTPNYMWMTFKTDVGIMGALDHKTFKFGNHKFTVKRAQHPTDIKFENREISAASHTNRKRCFTLTVFLLGIVFFFAGNWLV